MEQPLFSVWQFFKDGTHECVRLRVSAEEAMKTAAKCIRLTARYVGNLAKTRENVRVIITDEGCNTVFVWTQKRGVAFPKLGGQDGTARQLRAGARRL